MRRILCTAVFSFVVLCVSAQVAWKQVEPGVWKGVVGNPEAYSLLGVSGVSPRSEALQKMAKVGLPAFADEVVGLVAGGKTSLRIPLQKGEQLYGFGLNFQTVHQRGKILNLHVDHYGGDDNGRTHAPVPFYVSSNGYGVLVNSARYLTVYAGSGVRKDSPNAPKALDRNTDKKWSSRPYSDAVELLIPASGVEIYLFAGPSPLEVICRYNLFCGGGALPPRWGLGFTQRTQRLYTDKQVKEEAAQFREKGFPLDYIGLEPGWQSKAYPCTFEWDQTRFPDPAGFVKEMANQGVRINLWTNPYISPESGIYKEMYPLSGSHTVWNGIVPDFASEPARKIWKDKLAKEHLAIGVSGYKVDEVDGYDHYLWPDVATFPSGISAEQMRQTYGIWVQKITTELYKETNTRTFGLVRASNAGANSFPYVIYNDYYSHEDFITALINSGYSGVLWTPEVRSSKTGEEWLRRFQSVVFSPMAMINAWSSGTKPWSFPEVAESVKKYALLRMEMMPYWYSTFARYHYEGMPPFRAMNLEPGFTAKITEEVVNQSLDDNPYLEAVNKEVKDQYMAGEYLLVAPMFTGQKSRKVILPRGNWYDFYTGAYAGNGEVITVTPGLETIPVYVKDGGIIPMMAPRLHAPKSGEIVDLEIRHYGTKAGSFRLYDDDGESFDYEKGEYSWRTLTVTAEGGKPLKGFISTAEPGKPNTVGKVTWKFMTPVAKKMEWWRDAKFGMFIHWGPYSLYGGVYNGFNQQRGGAEWIMNRCKIPVREYKAKASTFNPQRFDAEALVRLAKETGMKYMVLTTKHHDGFAMFQSDASNFTIVDYTPFKRDVVDEFVKACRKYAMPFGFYYSQSQDWNHPGGATARKLMMEGWPNPDSVAINKYTSEHKGAWDSLQTTASFNDYVQSVALPQIKELTGRYPDLSILWWDTPMSITDEQADLLLKVVEKYPRIITNDRLKRPNFPGDYRTPEGRIPKTEDIEGVDWETCMNIGSSWGYKSWESSWKSPEELIRNLITITALGGNYLLNVGPTPLGEIPNDAVSRLRVMGNWLSQYGEAIYGTSRTRLKPSWGECTGKVVNGRTVLYLCVFDWPASGKLVFDANFNVKGASLLPGNTQLKVKKENRSLVISVPAEAPDKIASVIKLELNQLLPAERIQSNSEKYFEIADE